MKANLKLIDTKVNLYARQGKPAWDYLSNNEREIYAEFLERKKHFLSASRFTTNENKRTVFLRLHKEVCKLEYS